MAEQYDGGYWYVVPTIQDAEGFTSVELPDGASVSIWYASEYGHALNVAVVRSPVALDLPQALDTQISEIFGNTIPYARIGGM